MGGGRRIGETVNKDVATLKNIAYLTRHDFRPLLSCPDARAFITTATGGSVLPEELQLETTDSFRFRAGGTLATPNPRSTRLPDARGSEGVLAEGWEEPLEELHPPEGACPSLVSLSCFN